ncbi:MAG: gliding motility-associated C-terminal domain-containing protein [Thermonemataceae bacterium]|nr:gliding motility-associated C-terminal domain-containing protein [Thermonemataceae bacterium]
MRKYSLIYFLLLCWHYGFSQPTSGILFLENKNQWSKDIQYKADIPSGFLFVYNNALQYSFYEHEALNYFKHKEFYKDKPQYAHYEKQAGIKAHSFVVEFLGANPIQVKAQKPSPTHYNFYVGEKKQWASNVKGYETISYPNIYEGVDYQIFRKEHTLKYELYVQSHANPKSIQLAYRYADKLRLLPDGSLEIQTSVGSIYEKRPISYQLIRGQKVFVETNFILKDNIISFDFPKGYNKKYPLVIDPELVFSTYSGGSSDNWGNTATFDAAGNLYSGSTFFGFNFPNFTGAQLIGTPNGGVSSSLTDVGIFKYNSTGTTLLQLSVIGGSNSEVPHSLVVDSQNNLFILGTTSSNNFPSTFAGNTFQGGSSLTVVGISYTAGSDIFLMKLNPDGTLNSSKFIGGSGNDGLKPSGSTIIHNYGDELRGDVYVDSLDNVYIASTTRSTSVSGFTGTLSGLADGLIGKFDNALNLTWGKYFGGNGIDLALSIKTNNVGEVYVGGGTTSNNLPLTTGSYQSLAAGSDDGFLAKFDATGNNLINTYLGTSAADMAFFIDLDGEQEPHIFGVTSGDYPISTGVYSNANGGQFIHKISPDLTTSRWSTRIGRGDGNPDISPTAFLVVTESDCNNIYIAGWAGSLNGSGSTVQNMPITPDAYRGTTLNGKDFYIAVFRKNMERLIYGTFFGENTSSEVGDHVDGGTSRFSKDGLIYHSVCASCGGSDAFPITTGAWSATNNSSNCNNAVFKFKLNVAASFQMVNPLNSQVLTSGTEICEQRIFFKFLALDADEFLWEILDAGNNIIYSQNTEKDFYYTFNSSGNYKVRLTVTNCNQTDQALQDLAIIIPNFQIDDSLSVCKGSSIQLQASGANSYQWSPATGLSSTTIANPIASPATTTTYTVTFQDDKCRKTQKIKVEVLPTAKADFSYQLLKDCSTPYRVKLQLENTDTTFFTKFLWDMGDGNILEGINPAEYTYKEHSKTYAISLLAYNPNACVTTVKQEVIIPKPPIEPPNAITPNNDGLNDTFEIAEKGSKLEIWNRWGKRLFKSDDYQNDWGDEKEISAGIYYYHLESPSGAKCNGWVQVLK